MRTQHGTDHTSRLRWFKSSHSGSGGGDCVEVAIAPESVHVRDSKDPARRGLRVAKASWEAFAVHVRS
ncbi:DUF397 domain-containing protein [Streptomyces sp. JJ36]|uniref:DUF397 domain-containing protein n=1 Tax=Streptomyces sp. JJ36 TaxID=2736645 RepID=UPI001F1E8108|nr:DUF397 domain-containing protein [Streptomyces sp. JJ36]MCF6526161.1 DUF397 domain-containing protein [Streptomyces sp. JJ36]